ncbi:undecaprenyldiphospho-muramoylpentapeptide beta-N-acetylglucosaminyltransferase [Paenibacillus psychroresistens]|uniref:UDP-N-acetylglucosamine--N-acetylmuramyl-(pentapeptide) pyrophosphoryl-undecaprenol N-acetylglucosamine transferase n=1 Tax=Paenibacillus psychroresistens TaxID=1778678 RepID=A0A6B8RWM6_9BACL|nr:undecaprenyldiphospho-muramoylpentapeptide beta-N-acetylglucosaminyltransferase [Paenibacillus psychroresistens]QGR00036.1 undecaprenyldiphospho-muramoylpentapeptide beta-N-acetylglucosaminyltransferase [Paenibacillus psychroresistens]
MFTGGGSSGHVSVNLALIPHFQQDGWAVEYIGSENGIEKELILPLKQVKYFSIATGKLRRYLDWNNVKDPFKVVKGVFQAYRIIKKQKPTILFSKGGFVSVPVVLAAWLNKVPVIIHESDITPGLANRIAIPFATGVCTTFPETAQHLKSAKTHFVGAIIRDELKQGNKARGRAFCQLNSSKPVLLIMGGSLGAKRINQTVRSALNKLTDTFQIIHLCGKGQVDPILQSPYYRQYEYINHELPDVLAMTDVVISRAGANSIFEFLALRIPMLLIPLSKAQSRGDQILNAQSFAAAGYCEVLNEEALSAEALVTDVHRVYEQRQTYKEKMGKAPERDALSLLFKFIKKTSKKG